VLRHLEQVLDPRIVRLLAQSANDQLLSGLMTAEKSANTSGGTSHVE